MLSRQKIHLTGGEAQEEEKAIMVRVLISLPTPKIEDTDQVDVFPVIYIIVMTLFVSGVFSFFFAARPRLKSVCATL